MRDTSPKTTHSRQPDLSLLPPLNVFAVREEFQSEDPMAAAIARLSQPGTSLYARVDLELPLGCPFSLFFVRGYPRGEDCRVMEGTLVVCRDLAAALADNLDESEVLELRVEPRKTVDERDQERKRG